MSEEAEGVYDTVRMTGEETYEGPLHATESRTHNNELRPTNVYDIERVAEQEVYFDPLLHTEPQDHLYMELQQQESLYDTLRTAAFQVVCRYIDINTHYSCRVA